MSHGKHVRVIVNGHHLYNMGGKTGEQLLCQIKHPDWHPLTMDEWPLMFRVPQHAAPFGVRTVTFLAITRTQGGRRRITGMHQYVYAGYRGPVPHLMDVYHRYNVDTKIMENGKWVPACFDPEDTTYRTFINLIDMSVDEGEDMLGWVHDVPMVRKGDPKPVEKAPKKGFLTKFWDWITRK